MRITQNIPALITYNATLAAQSGLSKTVQRLSTGLRVNSAADDAAGLTISEKMRAQTRGQDQAARNAQDGVSMIQTAEGALNETHSILQRMRELSAQAANDSLTADDRTYVQLEIDQLKDEIDRIAATTQFNRRKLLDGSASALWSSDSLSTEALVRGGLTGADAFGRRVSAAGNYKIEITADPGEAQIQKSNIMHVATKTPAAPEQPPAEQPETPDPTAPAPAQTPPPPATYQTISLNDTGTRSGNGWTYLNRGPAFTSILTITGAGGFNDFKITGSGNNINIVVQGGAAKNIILENMRSETNYGAALDISGATVNLYLAGNNYLRESLHHPAFYAPPGSDLTITSYSGGDGSTDGSLMAISGIHCAGIGGGCNGMSLNTGVGNITINGGSVTAMGGRAAAGIGGGSGEYGVPDPNATAGNITINGGSVRAVAGSTAGWATGGGAGIGGGNGAAAGEITITGGDVVAEGDGGGAGIGGGSGGAGGNIAILGGTGTATGGGGGAGIGGGAGGASADISVSGGYDLGTSGVPGTIDTAEGGFTALGGPSAAANIDAVKKAEPLPGAPNTSDAPEVTLCALHSIAQFYDANGVLSAKAPQTITLYQGDGKSASVTLYADDTMYGAAEKINAAIAFGLGQSAYVGDISKFCTIADGTDGTSESVCKEEPVCDEKGKLKYTKRYATLLVRSAVPGAKGELTFSGSEELLKALGLSTIQESRESEFTVTVTDAHSGERVGETRKVTGSTIRGAVGDGVDVTIDPLAGIDVTWSEEMKRYTFSNADGTYTTYVHLADNTTTLQIGANEREDMTLHFGRFDTTALGLDGLLVVSRETAARAVTIIDDAIGKVSTQRARLGAYQNRLEHTTANLSAASTNLTAAESRIRDADIAKEMQNFTKLNITLQAGLSMSAQANQLPQNVLSLLR